MTNYDIAMIDLRVISGWVTYDQVQVLVLGASNTFEIKYQGVKRLRLFGEFPTDAGREEFSRVMSSFILDGWRPLGDDSSGLLIKDTEVSPTAVVPIPARLKYLDELLRTKKIDGSDARTLQIALMQLESLGDPDPAPVRAELVELLERLTELHRSGSLSDEQFEEAKNRALGL